MFPGIDTGGGGFSGSSGASSGADSYFDEDTNFGFNVSTGLKSEHLAMIAAAVLIAFVILKRR